jgi:hypothetical protein
VLVSVATELATEDINVEANELLIMTVEHYDASFSGYRTSVVIAGAVV